MGNDIEFSPLIATAAEALSVSPLAAASNNIMRLRKLHADYRRLKMAFELDSPVFLGAFVPLTGFSHLTTVTPRLVEHLVSEIDEVIDELRAKLLSLGIDPDEASNPQVED